MKSRAGKFKAKYIMLNLPTLDFLIKKIKDWEFQKIYFCPALASVLNCLVGYRRLGLSL